MTDTKPNEAPERIWACYGRVFSKRYDTLQPATEYVRANLPADMARQRDALAAALILAKEALADIDQVDHLGGCYNPKYMQGVARDALDAINKLESMK